MPEACPPASTAETTTPPAEPAYTPTELEQLLVHLLQEKGLSPIRETFTTLNSFSAPTFINQYKTVPWLRMYGEWMKAAGFIEHEQAKAIAYKGMLILIPGLRRPTPGPRCCDCNRKLKKTTEEKFNIKSFRSIPISF